MSTKLDEFFGKTLDISVGLTTTVDLNLWRRLDDREKEDYLRGRFAGSDFSAVRESIDGPDPEPLDI